VKLQAIDHDASEVRTCGLSAVVAVLLGAGIGVGWHYFADSAGGRGRGRGGNSPREAGRA